MQDIFLLDCTLRDGGYINDWSFGEETIKGYLKKMSQTGIEFCEAGFIAGSEYDPDKTLFPDTASTVNIVPRDEGKLKYVAMLDMNRPIPADKISRREESALDGIRVIFKKNKTKEAYEYCKIVKERGYMLFVNFVGTDQYTDQEFIEGIRFFNDLSPYAMTIVDSFGLIKRKQFLRLVYLADNNLADGIALGYHAHNNMQQAFGNAQALTELNLNRDIIIDACVFGMGRGAGNLNLELFAGFMNEDHEKGYQIEPMLEITDEYLNEIYKRKSWGYSLSFYLSAANAVHPDYASYFSQKDTLTAKSFAELLSLMSPQDKAIFDPARAEKYYQEYQKSYIDDKDVIGQLRQELSGRNIVMIAPGRSLRDNEGSVKSFIKEKNAIVLAVNFKGGGIAADYIFSSNMRRYRYIEGKTGAKCIVTSNMKDCTFKDYVVNFSSYAGTKSAISDNSGLMLLRLLRSVGIREVFVAGMDGYSEIRKVSYYDKDLEFDYSSEAAMRNELISNELKELGGGMKISFLTPTYYKI